MPGRSSVAAALALVSAGLMGQACGVPPTERPADDAPTPVGGAIGAGGGGSETTSAGGGTGSAGLGSGGQPPNVGGSTNPTGGSLAGGGPSAGGLPEGSGGQSDHEATLELFEHYWEFESVTGNQLTPSRGELTLTLDGGTLEPGLHSQALQLAGSSSAANEAPAIDTSASFSVMAWVKFDALADYSTVAAIGGDAVSAVYLQTRSDHHFSLTTFPTDSTSGTPCIATAEIRPRVGEWYFVVGTRDALTGEQRIYVDGALSGRSTCEGSVFHAQGQTTIGRGIYDGQPADYLQGQVDSVGFASRALSPSEIFSLYRFGNPKARHYLFGYFVEVQNGRGDGLRLAQSHDGLIWGALGAGKAFIKPTVGGKSFRDPHILFGEDGLYHVVWTTSCVPWAESGCVQDRGFGHASAPDLVHFTDPQYVPIDLNVEHVWAPETHYDPDSQSYLIFWSSPLDQNPSASDPHSIYFLNTKDFITFGAPEILYSRPGRNFIDATIFDLGDTHYMFLKDEADGQKNIRAVPSSTLSGTTAWTADPSAALTGNYAAEGPSALARDGELFLYFDKYADGTYGALRGTAADGLTSPSHWTDISSDVYFPGVRHGTPIEVSWEVYEQVALAAGE